MPNADSKVIYIKWSQSSYAWSVKDHPHDSPLYPSNMVEDTLYFVMLAKAFVVYLLSRGMSSLATTWGLGFKNSRFRLAHLTSENYAQHKWFLFFFFLLLTLNFILPKYISWLADLGRLITSYKFTTLSSLIQLPILLLIFYWSQ